MIRFYSLNDDDETFDLVGTGRYYNKAGWVIDPACAGVLEALRAGEWQDREDKPLLLTDSKERLETELPDFLNRSGRSLCEVVPDDFDPDAEPPAVQAGDYPVIRSTATNNSKSGGKKGKPKGAKQNG